MTHKEQNKALRGCLQEYVTEMDKGYYPLASTIDKARSLLSEPVSEGEGNWPSDAEMEDAWAALTEGLTCSYTSWYTAITWLKSYQKPTHDNRRTN